MVKKPFFEAIFQFSRVPPLEIVKNRFSNMKSPLKLTKTSKSFSDFVVFFIFWPKNHGFGHFWPQNHKNPEEILPPPSFWCHNPAPTTTLCLAMFCIRFFVVAVEMATSFPVQLTGKMPQKRCHNPAPTTTLCLAMSSGVCHSLQGKGQKVVQKLRS